MKTYVVLISFDKKVKIRADSYEWDCENETVDFFVGRDRVAVFLLDRIYGFYEKR